MLLLTWTKKCAQPTYPSFFHTHKSQGDLGHTDLQEDLEFHSSSKILMFFSLYIADMDIFRL